MFGGGYDYQPYDFSQLQMGSTPPLGQGLLSGMTPPTDPNAPAQQSQGHHGGLHGILPYLGLGLLGGSLLGSGAVGQLAPLLGLGGILAKKAGLFK